MTETSNRPARYVLVPRDALLAAARAYRERIQTESEESIRVRTWDWRLTAGRRDD